ncbi:MAG: FAD-binding protein [Clostridia bacterium]|nr:FAD-binding oxidoreductase [Lachnospiraceae bacterium]NCB99570.1 FAD-binding protein [Clostridia bacterium]NCD01774.1 FAD-binding protein [Clostridia bacterium]
MTVIRDIIKDEKRIVEENIDEKYQSDVLGRLKGCADTIVFPISTEEVSGLMKYAWENQIPVTPRGAGTNLVGSTVPVRGGIVLDLSLMNHILEVDEDTMTATVEPGVLLEDFQSYVEEKGLFYPPDPGEKKSTIAGNISTNAGGMRAVKYGVTRDYVRGLELVLANGDVIRAGSKNIKDASGLSLKNLIIGSEGTLAVITKCILKLIPKPEYSLSVLVPYPDIQTGTTSVLALLKGNAAPTAVEFIERGVARLGEDFTGVSFPHPEAGAYMLLTFDGEEEEVALHIKKARKLALGKGAIDFVVLDDPEKAAAIWKTRGALVKAVEAVSEQEPVDLVVPISQVEAFIRFVGEQEERSGMQLIRFGHAGDGNVHLCVVRGDRDDAQWEKELHENMTALYGKAYALGGLTSGEHGIGLSKRPYYLEETSDLLLETMRRIKYALDERGILNNHKSYLA